MSLDDYPKKKKTQIENVSQKQLIIRILAKIIVLTPAV
jgi:hypothetical protein